MRFKPVLALLTSFSLLACGGGGGGGGGADPGAPRATNDVADKYVGTWVGCGAEGANSGRLTFVATKTSPTSISYTINSTQHVGSTTCAGAGTPSYSEQGTVVYRGTRVIGNDTVDLGEGTVTFNNDPSDTEPRVERDISLVSGNTIFFGVDAPLDADGYPTAIDRTFFATKQ